MKAFALALVLGLLTAPAALAQHLPVIDELVEPHVGVDAPGIAVLVTRYGKPIHLRGYRLADIATGRPVDAHSRFDLASVSKQMTALVAMLLIEDGTLALDMPVSDFMPAFQNYGDIARPLRVADLLHHLGGLPDYLDGELDYDGDTPDSEVVAWLAARPPLRAPGTEFEYSNSGYVVLGSLIAAAEGADNLGDVLHRRVWDVLGMAETGFAPYATQVTGYAGMGGNFRQSAWANLAQGDGDVLASIGDFVRYEAALNDNSLLTKSALKRLFANALLDDGSPLDQGDGSGYTFGWTVETWHGSRYAWHDGSWYGAATTYLRNLDTGISVVVLSNGEDLDVTTLAFDIEAAAE